MKTLFLLSTLYCVCSCLWIDKKNAGAVAECCPLTGTWVTESGTYIELKHNADGKLTGKYYDISTEGTKMEVIHGQAGKGKPTTFGFVVSLKNGESTKVWTGHYQFCNGEATLTTRWMMSSVSKACSSGKQPDLIGEDTFVRKSASHKRSKMGHYIRKMFNKLFRQKMQ